MPADFRFFEFQTAECNAEPAGTALLVFYVCRVLCMPLLAKKHVVGYNTMTKGGRECMADTTEVERPTDTELKTNPEKMQKLFDITGFDGLEMLIQA